MPLLLALACFFTLGAIVGSFLNVCIYRIPQEKSILWPGSHCGRCVQPIRWYDNVPLVSYWVLGGRCRVCGAPYSVRYFLVELLTALCFAGLFYLEVVANVHGLDVFKAVRQHWDASGSVELRLVPPAGWGFFAYHAALVCFLLVNSFCDLDSMEIPFSVTGTGTLVGLAGGALLWPSLPASARVDRHPVLPVVDLSARPGVYPWPAWDRLPAWLPPDGWLTGLVTGLAGFLAGMVVLRLVRFVFGVGRGVEGLGVGDADLMMMAGSFLGWQPVVIAFFVAVFPALLFGLVQLFTRGNQMMPFGPSLALGTAITLLAWPSLGPRFAGVFFEGAVVLTLVVFGVVVLLAASFLLRILRR